MSDPVKGHTEETGEETGTPAYLDFASTTPPHPDAHEAFLQATFEAWADPSRLYGAARRARIALDEARATIAATIGARPEEIVLTSGGTESCNLAIFAGAKAAAASRKPKRILVSAVEHSAVLEPARALAASDGFELVTIPVGSDARIDLVALRAACEEGAGLVSVQHANHEVGTLQPVAEAAAIAKAAGAFFHTDACMTVGQIPVTVSATGADLLSASSHKSYGPAGSGLLWARRGVRIRPLLTGDDRERGRRAGMESLAAAAGFAAALTARASEIPGEMVRLRAMTERLRREIPDHIPGCVALGHESERLPGLVAFSIDGVEGETLLLLLDAEGISVHSGSSCAATATEPSHVLVAMGAPTEGSLRVSLGRTTTDEHGDRLIATLPGIVAKVRALTG